MEDLHREAEMLKRIEGRMQEQFEAAKQAGKEIDDQVDQWLKEAQNIGDIVKSNWLVDHKKARSEAAAINMIRQVNTFVAEGKSILCVCFDTDTKGIELEWRDDFVKFASRKDVYKRIMDALKDDQENGIIGIIGMGGIGKTKLVVELGKKAQDEVLFSKVVMTTVTKRPNIKKIQGKLADMVNLKFKEDTEIGRSNELRTELEKQRKMLVILDDVWEKIDIERIGIPFQSEHKGCMILLTTRSEEVSQVMGCRFAIHLDAIEEEEAYNLFSRCAGRDPNLKKSAKKIVQECRGLPLAVVTVGSALRGKSVEEYNLAAWNLSKSSYVEIENVDRDIYPCLKLSYDYLEDTETQKCFLSCSLYPEDTEIEVGELMRNAYGLCLFENVESADQVREKMIASVTKLVNACLLSLVIDYDTGAVDVYSVNYLSRVKMHDMLRDVAVWTAKSSGLFLVPTSLKQCQRKNMHGKTTAVYVVPQDIDDKLIPPEIPCPNLKILIIRIGPTTLPGNFFKTACSLEVLDLLMEDTRQFDISLPASFRHLVNLKVLRVFGEYLRYNNDMSIIRKFKSLEILELSFPADEKILPEWIGELCNLRVLDLSQCFHMELIPCNLLPKLAKLEELYTPRYHVTEWSHAHLDDLRLLPRLSVVTGWYVGNDNFENRKERMWSNHGRARILRLDDFNDDSLRIFERVWPGIGCLDIRMTLMQGVKNLCPQLDSIGFPNLRKLTLSDSTSLECFIDTASERGLTLRSRVLSNLLDLSLSRMEQLRRICNGPPPHLDFLGNLRHLEILLCPMIENLVPDMLPVAPQLKKLKIWSCGALKSLYNQVETRIHQLPSGSCEAEKQRLISVGYGDAVLHAMTLDAMLVSLTSVDIGYCSNLEEVFPVSKANNMHRNWKLKNLVDLILESLPKLRCIWKIPQQIYCLHNLETLYLSKCDKLSTVFSFTLAQSLVKLKCLVVKKCAMLETIISPDKQDEPLKWPYSSTSGASFQELQILVVKSCHKLKTVLPVAYASKCLPNLTDITIKRCVALEEVFGTGEENKPDSQSPDVEMKRLKHLELEDLPKLVPFSEFTCNQMLTSLRKLKISGGTFKQNSNVMLAEGQEKICKGILLIGAGASSEDDEDFSCL